MKRPAVVRLGDVAKVRSGFAFKSKDWVETGVPVVKIQNVRNGRVSLEGCSFVSPMVADQATRYRLHRGDLLVTMSGEIGSVGVVRFDHAALLNQRVGRFEVTEPEKLDAAYLLYVLSQGDLKKHMEAVAYGAAQPNISPSLIEDIDVPLPALNVQARIASTLGDFDGLIENNTRRIGILDEMSRTIYREWFVAFRYPGHVDVPLVDSDLGPIPDGWNVKPLCDVSTIVMGASPKSEFYNDAGDGLAFHQGVTDFGPHFPSTRIFSTAGDRRAEPGDILFSVRAPVGRINVATNAVILGRGLCSIRPEPTEQMFLLHQMKYRFRELDTMGNGAIFNAVTRSDVNGIRILRAPPRLVARFEQTVGPMFDLISNLTVSSDRLRLARNLLLPRLISGEVDVSDIDHGSGDETA